MEAQERIFRALLDDAGLPQPISEYQFHPQRKFRADYAWPDQKLLLEQEGGIYGRGPRCPLCKRRAPQGHHSISGITRDIAKYNLAALLGFRVLRCTPEDLHSHKTIEMLRTALGQ